MTDEIKQVRSEVLHIIMALRLEVGESIANEVKTHVNKLIEVYEARITELEGRIQKIIENAAGADL